MSKPSPNNNYYLKRLMKYAVPYKSRLQNELGTLLADKFASGRAPTTERPKTYEVKVN
jgi:hypothetical protein